MRVNLLKQNKSGSNINVTYITIIVLVVIFSLVGFFHYHRSKSKYAFYKNRLNNLNNRISNLEEKKKEYNKLKKQVNDLSKHKIADNSYLWDQLLITLGNKIPEQVMIENLKIEGKTLTLEGIGHSSENIADFISRLSSSQLFKNIEIEQLLLKEDLQYVIKGKIKDLKREDG